MSTFVASGTSVFTTDATFRTLGALVSTSFAAAGLVQAADTGQADWTTIAKPTVADAFAGYEVWRFNDSLQATAPIYLKISYYSSGNASGNNLVLRVGVGTATNGTGTLGGCVMTASPGPSTSRRVVQANSVATWSLRMCHAPGAFTALSAIQETSNNTSPFNFGISRTIDSAGAFTTAGAYFWFVADTGAILSYSLNFATSTTYGSTNVGAAPPADLANYDSGNVSYALAHYACLPAPVVVPGVVTVRSVVTEGATFTLSLNGGTPRTYLVWGFDPALATSRWGPYYPNAFSSATAGLTNEGLYSMIGVIWE